MLSETLILYLRCEILTVTSLLSFSLYGKHFTIFTSRGFVSGYSRLSLNNFQCFHFSLHKYHRSEYFNSYCFIARNRQWVSFASSKFLLLFTNII